MITRSLCEICNPKQWKTISTEMLTNSGYPVYGANGVIGCYKEYNHTESTLLITCRGATCGSLNICEPFSYVNGNAMALDDLSLDIDLKYLYYYLLNRGLNDTITGSAQPQIVRQSLQKVLITYPILEKQKEVVNKLDKASDLIKKRKQQILKLDELVKSRFIEMFNDYPTLCALGDYIQELRAGKSVAGVEECENKVLKTGAATFGYFDENQVKNLPLDYLPNRNHLVENGDAIISRMNTPDLVGTCSYVWKAPKNTYYPDRLWKTLVKPNVNAIFIWQLMQQNSVRLQIKEYASGTSGSMWNISKPNLLKIKAVKVPIEFQNQFAEFVEQVEKQKANIKQSLEKLEILKKSLMQKYFG